jgi:glucose/arabinose dehydrogenase
LIAVKSNRYGWAGDFLLGALKLQHLNRLVMRGDQAVEEKRYFEDQGERIRDVLEDSKGMIWVITDSGKLQQMP